MDPFLQNTAIVVTLKFLEERDLFVSQHNLSRLKHLGDDVLFIDQLFLTSLQLSLNLLLRSARSQCLHSHMPNSYLVNLELQLFNLKLKLVPPQGEQFNRNDHFQKGLRIPHLIFQKNVQLIEGISFAEVFQFIDSVRLIFD